MFSDFLNGQIEAKSWNTVSQKERARDDMMPGARETYKHKHSDVHIADVC